MSARCLALALCVAIFAAGCGSKQPVFYPNAAYEEFHEEEINEIVEACKEEARQAEIADSRKKGAAKGATGGAILGGLIGGAIGWIFGNPGRGAAAGAVHGGGSGAAKGAGKSGESDQTFQAYVDACLREYGLQPVGWK